MKTVRQYSSPLSLLLLAIAAFTASASALAANEGGHSGGGGDASEIRVNEIRADILKWISEGGVEGLRFPQGMNASSYRAQMMPVLAPHAVVLGFVTRDQESKTSDPELKVSVDEQPKTCRGFFSNRDKMPHILCNTERFTATPEAKQYPLIHHEYAGLAGVEQNQGASSDYAVSSQITEYLVPENVLRLSVRKTTPISSNFWTGAFELVGANGNKAKMCMAKLKLKEINTFDYSNQKPSRGIEYFFQDGGKQDSVQYLPGTKDISTGCNGNFCEKGSEMTQWQGESLIWHRYVKFTNDCPLGFWCSGPFNGSSEVTQWFNKVDAQTLQVALLQVVDGKKDAANADLQNCNYRKVE